MMIINNTVDCSCHIVYEYLQKGEQKIEKEDEGKRKNQRFIGLVLVEDSLMLKLTKGF